MKVLSCEYDLLPNTTPVLPYWHHSAFKIKIVMNSY